MAKVLSSPKKKTLQEISNDLRRFVNNYIGLNRNERAALYKTAYLYIRGNRNNPNWRLNLSRVQTFDTVLKTARRVQKSYDLSVKKDVVKALLRRDEYIFYRCSEHVNPAEGHKEYQGKIFVDRFWRQKIDGSLYYNVLSYIKKNKIMTVQEAMQGPIWLITRPYCKHYFIPEKTSDVLSDSVDRSMKKIDKKDDNYTVQDYYKLRAKTYETIYKTTPCKEFNNVLKKTKRMIIA